MLVRSLIYGWGFDFMRPFHSAPTKVNMVDVAQLVSASDCGSEGRGFDSHHPPHKMKPHPFGWGFVVCQRRPNFSLSRCSKTFLLGGRWPKGPDEGIQSGKEPPHQSKIGFEVPIFDSFSPGRSSWALPRRRDKPQFIGCFSTSLPGRLWPMR